MKSCGGGRRAHSRPRWDAPQSHAERKHRRLCDGSAPAEAKRAGPVGRGWPPGPERFDAGQGTRDGAEAPGIRRPSRGREPTPSGPRSKAGMGANGPKMACGSLFPQETAWPRLRKGEWTTCEAARLMSAASVPAGGRRQPNRLRGLAERISQYRPREKVSREKQAFSQEPMHGHQRKKSRHLSGISNAACIPFTWASALDGYVLLSKMGDKPVRTFFLT